MTFATVLCWFSWGIVILNINPFEASLGGFLFFYVSLFFSLLGTASLIAVLLYRLFSRQGLPLFRYVQKGFRDGCVLAGGVILLLFLQSKSLLNWWNIGAFIFVLFFLVLFQRSTQRSSSAVDSFE